MRVSVLGAGSWGTALAIHLARCGHDVLLWSRDAAVASRPESVKRFRGDAAAWTFPPWHARACVLYTSRLEPGGAVHTPLAEWSFQRGTENRTG